MNTYKIGQTNPNDVKHIIRERDPQTGKRVSIEVFPEDEGYERSITIYRTPDQ